MKPFLKPVSPCAAVAFLTAACTTTGNDPLSCEGLNPVTRGLEFNIDLEARGVANNPAFSYVECLADNSVKFAQYWLGMFYLNGNGVPQNYDLAAKYLKRAAQSRSGIDTVYLQGQGGNLDFEQEFQARPDEEGIAEARFELAKLFLAGTGVKQSRSRAISYLELAAAQDHPGASALLAQVTGGGGE